MATQSSILDWEIPWTEEPGLLQSLGSQSWTRLSTHTCKYTAENFCSPDPRNNQVNSLRATFQKHRIPNLTSNEQNHCKKHHVIDASSLWIREDNSLMKWWLRVREVSTLNLLIPLYKTNSGEQRNCINNTKVKALREVKYKVELYLCPIKLQVKTNNIPNTK